VIAEILIKVVDFDGPAIALSFRVEETPDVFIRKVIRLNLTVKTTPKLLKLRNRRCHELVCCLLRTQIEETDTCGIAKVHSQYDEATGGIVTPTEIGRDLFRVVTLEKLERACAMRMVAVEVD
jgi:hypothetical protein